MREQKHPLQAGRGDGLALSVLSPYEGKVLSSTAIADGSISSPEQCFTAEWAIHCAKWDHGSQGFLEVGFCRCGHCPPQYHDCERQGYSSIRPDFQH
jgi:hypothetical protein